MIRRLFVRNFQSHKKSELIFHPNVNALIGRTDSGKTALLRAIKWLKDNRPLGTSFVSHWNQDKDGVPVKNTQVLLENDRRTIVRRRNSEFNGYLLSSDNNEEPDSLDAGKDVPSEIEKILNLDSVNVQNQMDAPFLLASSSAEVARFFNSQIRLDLIDRVLSNAELRRKRIKQDLTREQEKIDAREKQVQALSWLDDAETLLKKAASLEKIVNDCDEIEERLSGEIDAVESCESKIKDFAKVVAAEKTLKKTRDLLSVMEEKDHEARSLRDSISKYESTQKEIDSIPDMVNATALLRALLKMKNALDKKRDEFSALDQSIGLYEECERAIDRQRETIEENWALLPDVCPLCGGTGKLSHEHE